jgi:hypothetical protein
MGGTNPACLLKHRVAPVSNYTILSLTHINTEEISSMRQDDINVAFDVVADTLDAVVADINSRGAAAFSDGRYEDATRLSHKGGELQELRAKLSKFQHEWNDEYDEPERTRVQAATQRRRTDHTRSPWTNLQIHLPSGRVIDRGAAAHRFAEAIAEIGPERVKRLGLVLNRTPLIDEEEHDQYTQVKVGTHYIMTHCNTAKKKELLEEIAERLGLDLTVDVVD